MAARRDNKWTPILVTLGLLAITGVALAVRKKGAPGGQGLQDYGEGKMGKYFSWDEFVWSQTAYDQGIEEQWSPPQTAVITGMELAQWVMDPVREFLGDPVYVNSWYRSPELNAYMVASPDFPAAENSNHMKGGAADIRFMYNGEKRNDLLMRGILASGVPFDRVLIEHGTEERPAWIQVEYDPSLGYNGQRGLILRIPSGTSGYYLTRAEAEAMYL